jgi:hypothetical protein
MFNEFCVKLFNQPFLAAPLHMDFPLFSAVAAKHVPTWFTTAAVQDANANTPAPAALFAPSSVGFPGATVTVASPQQFKAFTSAFAATKPDPPSRGLGSVVPAASALYATVPGATTTVTTRSAALPPSDVGASIVGGGTAAVGTSAGTSATVGPSGVPVQLAQPVAATDAEWRQSLQRLIR